MRRSALAYLRLLARRGCTLEAAAEQLGIARETLGRWQREREQRLREGRRAALTPRGRPAQHATGPERRELLAVLHEEGSGVGVPALQERFSNLARREIEELCARHAYALRRRGRETLHVLHWHRPGAVWALDFTATPCLVDALYPKLMLVRDLASHAELDSLPVSGESAAETVLGLEHLFTVHGAPLVLKEDNGPGGTSEATRELCARYGVLILYSPPLTPSYNGAREAAGGSLKRRTLRIAAAQGRAEAWSTDDVERARAQMNHGARPWGMRGPSPAAAWHERVGIAPEERAAFQATYRRLEAEQRALDGIAPGTLLTRAQQAIIDRAALSRALRTHGLLEVRRG